MKRVSLDIETCCDVKDCPHYGGTCDHGLDPYRNRITIIGLVWRDLQGQFDYATVRSAAELRALFEDETDYEFTGANLKWDLKVLSAKGWTVPLAHWADDVNLMATCFTQKVSEDYLAWYKDARKAINEALPKGAKHRFGYPYSLKVMAPYFLDVEPFWEDPTNHDSSEYVLKDCEYTYLLTEYFEEELKAEGSYDFYHNKMMNWTKLLLRMELRGITVDLGMIEEKDKEAQLKAEEIKRQLDLLWVDGYKAYRTLKQNGLKKVYTEKEAAAVGKAAETQLRQLAKAKTPKAEEKAKQHHQQRLLDISERYSLMYQKAAEDVPLEMNLNSPIQLSWLFKHFYKLDITDFDDEESTGKAVLQRLAGEGHKDVALFLEYRKYRKLTSSFFPTYRDLHVDGVIHASFHPHVVRTGRLSSSDPNLQQVPHDLHTMFMARPGYRLITKDESAIEPRLLALVSDDVVLFDILKNGQDFHGFNTKVFFELEDEVGSIKKNFPVQREVSKEVGLALLYGAGKYRLQESAQKRGFLWSMQDCKRKIERFKEAFEGVYQYRELVNGVLLDGAIQNIAGRWFKIQDPQEIFMTGLNTLIQGSASDLVLHSAYRAQKQYDDLGLDAHVVLLVHDEIVVEAAEACVEQADKILETCMTDYDLHNSLGKIQLKVEGKVSDRWEK